MELPVTLNADDLTIFNDGDFFIRESAYFAADRPGILRLHVVKIESLPVRFKIPELAASVAA
jgi:hypothetical protein